MRRCITSAQRSTAERLSAALRKLSTALHKLEQEVGKFHDPADSEWRRKMAAAIGEMQKKLAEELKVESDLEIRLSVIRRDEFKPYFDDAD